MRSIMLGSCLLSLLLSLKEGIRFFDVTADEPDQNDGDDTDQVECVPAECWEDPSGEKGCEDGADLAADSCQRSETAHVTVSEVLSDHCHADAILAACANTCEEAQNVEQPNIMGEEGQSGCNGENPNGVGESAHTAELVAQNAEDQTAGEHAEVGNGGNKASFCLGDSQAGDNHGEREAQEHDVHVLQQEAGGSGSNNPTLLLGHICEAELRLGILLFFVHQPHLLIG